MPLVLFASFFRKGIMFFHLDWLQTTIPYLSLLCTYDYSNVPPCPDCLLRWSFTNFLLAWPGTMITPISTLWVAGISLFFFSNAMIWIWIKCIFKSSYAGSLVSSVALLRWRNL
jgi:hypothetical protein